MPCSMTLGWGPSDQECLDCGPKVNVGSAAPVLQMVSLASVKAESSAMVGHDWTCFGGGGMDVRRMLVYGGQAFPFTGSGGP